MGDDIIDEIAAKTGEDREVVEAALDVQQIIKTLVMFFSFSREHTHHFSTTGLSSSVFSILDERGTGWGGVIT